MTIQHGSVLRVFLLGLVGLGIWYAARTFEGLPTPRPDNAPATEFSQARARAVLVKLLGPEIPHPVSSDANAAVRERIRAAFGAIGVRTIVYRATGCSGRADYGYFACGTAQDILADVLPGQGKAIILLAHYDSVPAGPGAADDLSGVATILEAVRALKARGLKSLHPIEAVITDGEEAGLLGAAAFLHNKALKARVGAVINVEARGNQGPSILFQTSPGDGRLIDLYANAVPNYATSSLFSVIYRYLPNDTDLTLFIKDGFVGFNFAFVGEVAHYHTALDRLQNLSPATLQMHGDNLLGIAAALMQTDFAALKGSDDIYLSIFGWLLPRVPASFAVALSVVAFGLLLIGAYFSRREWSKRGLVAFAIVPLAVIAAALLGWFAFETASLVSAQPDPSYAYPVWLRAALGFGVLASTVLVSRLANATEASYGVWLWIAGLAILTAILLPGMSPYFLFPSLVAAILLALLSIARFNQSSPIGRLVVFLAALPMLTIWLSLAASSETIQGLYLHPLLTIPAAMGAVALVPLLSARPLRRSSWLAAIGGSLVFSAVLGVIAGVTPAYSTIAPQRLNIDFVDDHVSNKALWAIDTVPPLPERLRRAAVFSDKPQRALPAPFSPVFVTPAGQTRFDLPAADVVIRRLSKGREVKIALEATGFDRVFILVPPGSGLVQAGFADWSFTPSAHPLSGFGTMLACVTRDCSNKVFTLRFAQNAALVLGIGAQRYFLPGDGVKLVEARPRTTVPSQSGDTTIVYGTLRLR